MDCKWNAFGKLLFTDDYCSYPYPLMDQMNTIQRVILFGVAVLLMSGSTIMLKWLHGKLNGIQEDEKLNTRGNKNDKKNL